MKPKQHCITSHCPEETIRLGAFLGQQLKSGSVVALSGELGSGKTCLTQGIAVGLKVPKDLCVTSPSYSLINEYRGRLRLYHVDLYRLEHVSELEEIGLEEILCSNGVTVIEWAEKLLNFLPDERLHVAISIVNNQTRDLHLAGHGRRAADLVEKCVNF